MRPRIVFLGSPEAAVPVLAAAREIGEVRAVVTQPDRPAGRGRRPAPPPVADAARAFGLRVLQPERIRSAEVREMLASLEPDVLLVAAYGRILPRAVLDLAPRGCVNVHFSLLPRHRGAAPVARAILAGDDETGVTLMLLDEGMDTGPILARRMLRIGPEETTGELTQRLAEMGAAMVREDLPRHIDGSIEPVPQPETGVSMAPMLDKSEGRIEWDRPAAEVHRRIRAVTPWPGAFGFLLGRRVVLHRVRLLDSPASPGAGVVIAQGRRMAAGCADGCIEVMELQREGGRRIDAASFLAGFPLPLGTRFEETAGQ